MAGPMSKSSASKVRGSRRRRMSTQRFELGGQESYGENLPDGNCHSLSELASIAPLDRASPFRKNVDRDRKEGNSAPEYIQSLRDKLAHSKAIRLSQSKAQESHGLDRRGEKALALWEKRSQDWEEIKKRIARKIRKENDRLVMSTADAYRQRREAADFLQRASQAEHQSSQSWLLSLRDEGVRYVPVGNAFSGLYCKVKENATLISERILRPKGHIRGSLASFLDSSPKTERSLQKTAKDACFSTSQNQLARANDDRGDQGLHLFVEGRDLHAWALESSKSYLDDLRGLRELQAAHFQGSKGSQSPTPQEQLASEGGVHEDEPSILDNSPLRLEVVISEAGGVPPADRCLMVPLIVEVGMNYASRRIIVKNVGNQIVPFRWRRSPQGFGCRELNGGPKRKWGSRVCAGQFSISRTSGILYPGEVVAFQLTYTSQEPGKFSQSYQMIHEIDSNHIFATVVVNGWAKQPFYWTPAPTRTTCALSNQAEKHIDDVLLVNPRNGGPAMVLESSVRDLSDLEDSSKETETPGYMGNSTNISNEKFGRLLLYLKVHIREMMHTLKIERDTQPDPTCDDLGSIILKMEQSLTSLLSSSGGSGAACVGQIGTAFKTVIGLIERALQCIDQDSKPPIKTYAIALKNIRALLLSPLTYPSVLTRREIESMTQRLFAPIGDAIVECRREHELIGAGSAAEKTIQHTIMASVEQLASGVLKKYRQLSDGSGLRGKIERCFSIVARNRLPKDSNQKTVLLVLSAADFAHDSFAYSALCQPNAGLAHDFQRPVGPGDPKTILDTIRSSDQSDIFCKAFSTYAADHICQIAAEGTRIVLDIDLPQAVPSIHEALDGKVAVFNSLEKLWSAESPPACVIRSFGDMYEAATSFRRESALSDSEGWPNRLDFVLADSFGSLLHFMSTSLPIDLASQLRLTNHCIEDVEAFGSLAKCLVDRKATREQKKLLILGGSPSIRDLEFIILILEVFSEVFVCPPLCFHLRSKCGDGGFSTRTDEGTEGNQNLIEAIVRKCAHLSIKIQLPVDLYVPALLTAKTPSEEKAPREGLPLADEHDSEVGEGEHSPSGTELYVSSGEGDNSDGKEELCRAADGSSSELDSSFASGSDSDDCQDENYGGEESAYQKMKGAEKESSKLRRKLAALYRAGLDGNPSRMSMEACSFNEALERPGIRHMPADIGKGALATLLERIKLCENVVLVGGTGTGAFRECRAGTKYAFREAAKKNGSLCIGNEAYFWSQVFVGGKVRGLRSGTAHLVDQLFDLSLQ